MAAIDDDDVGNFVMDDTDTLGDDTDDLADIMGVLMAGDEGNFDDSAANFVGVDLTDDIIDFAEVVPTLFAAADDFMVTAETFTVDVGGLVDAVGPFIGVENDFTGDVTVTLAADI